MQLRTERTSVSYQLSQLTTTPTVLLSVDEFKSLLCDAAAF